MATKRSKKPILEIRFFNTNMESMVYFTRSMSDGQILTTLRLYFIERGYMPAFDYDEEFLMEKIKFIREKLNGYGVPFYIFCFERMSYHKHRRRKEKVLK